jgi:hypothetical protein
MKMNHNFIVEKKNHFIVIYWGGSCTFYFSKSLADFSFYGSFFFKNLIKRLKFASKFQGMFFLFSKNSKKIFGTTFLS